MAEKSAVIELKTFISTIYILGVLIIAAGILSYLIPAGSLELGMKNGQNIAVYQQIEQTPVPIWKIVLSPLLCLTGANGINIAILIVFILTVGGVSPL